MSVPVRAPSRSGPSRGPVGGAQRVSAGAWITLGAIAVPVVLGALLPQLTSAFAFRDLALLLFAAVLAAVAWLHPSASIVTTVGAFVFSALLRRVFPAADPAADMAAIFPFIVAIPLAVHGLRCSKPGAVTLLLIWTTFGAALAVGTPLVALAGWLNFAVPLLAAFGVRRIPTGLSVFARATVICGSIAATYGIVQYFVPFSWDVAWLARAGVRSIGTFGESNFRPFGTLPAPQTAATLSAVVILLMVFQRQLVQPSALLRGWALSSSAVFLLLTLARSVWAGLAAALVVGVLATRGRPARQLVPFVGVVMGFVLFAPQGDIVVERAQTFTNLEEDTSYNARLDLVDRTAALISPVGIGLGKLSSGSRAASDATLDNGYLVVLGELGLVGLILLGWALVWLSRHSRPPEYGFLSPPVHHCRRQLRVRQPAWPAAVDAGWRRPSAGRNGRASRRNRFHRAGRNPGASIALLHARPEHRLMPRPRTTWHKTL